MQGLVNRLHVVPPDLQVVLQAAIDQVHVRIIEAWDDRPLVQVNDHRERALERNRVTV